MRTPRRTLTALTLAVPLALATAAPADAAPKPRRNGTDNAAPTVAIASPTSGSSVGSGMTVTGSASDNVGVASVSVAVDGGGWQAVNGTSSWSAVLSGLTAGSHTLTARAKDAAGNVGTASVSVTVVTSPSPSPSPTTSPSPSPTTSPSPTPTTSPSPSPTATTSPSPSPSPTSTTSAGSAPNTQGSWTSPEGVRINVNSAGSWTIAQVYSMLKENALELSTIGPLYTINVQDQYAAMTTVSVNSTGGVYSDYRATTYLKGTSSLFVTWPDYVLSREYAIAWAQYHLYLHHGGSWDAYLSARWANADGSVRLGQDSRLYSSISWDPGEIIADDYRLLFGSAAAVSQRNSSINTTIPDPRNQPGLGSWLLDSWA